MATLTLHTDDGNFRAFKALICSEYNGVNVSVRSVKLGVDNTTADFKKKSPCGRVPVLETPQGCIFESNAIARYIASIRRDSNLYGNQSLFAQAQIDQWIYFCAHDIELPATIWSYPVFGYMPANAAATAKAKEDLKKALGVLEAHLADKTYLVGHTVTLADVTVVSALVYPFKFVADAKYRAPFPNVMRWFNTCVNQPEFAAVIGNVPLCEKELTAAGSAVAGGAAGGAKGGKAQGGGGDKKEKKEKAPKAPKEDKPKEAPKPKEEKKKAPKPKEDDDDEPEPEVVEKKQDHPFKIMDQTNKSTFVMDTWKKTYSNAESYEAAMETFWQTFDPAGWSIWRGDYMYNEECKVLFMTGNLIGGFIQRTEEIRKWLFGTMTIRGVEGEFMKITCYYLIRGDSIEPLIKCNDDAACYKWTKMEIPASEADKKLLFDYWCSEGPLEGEPNLDSRCYK